MSKLKVNITSTKEVSATKIALTNGLSKKLNQPTTGSRKRPSKNKNKQNLVAGANGEISRRKMVNIRLELKERSLKEKSLNLTSLKILIFTSKGLVPPSLTLT